MARRSLSQFISHDIAIDLGTANTLVYLAGHGIIIDEPSVVATNRKTKRVIAIGAEAKAMVGRMPKSLLAARPLVDGVVSDFEVTEHMLNYFVSRIHQKSKVLVRRPRVAIGLPYGVSEVERRAVEEAAKSAGARKIYLIEEPVAAAIGSGLELESEEGSMIVDIGGGTTEIAVLAGGQVILARSLRIAGDEMTDAILQFVRDELNMQIGERTAERIKTKIGSVYNSSEVKTLTIRGRNVITGLPHEMDISSDTIRKAMVKQIRPIVDGVKTVLEETPPELISDILKRGILLAGGGALIQGVDQLIQAETHIATYIADNALTAVVEGAAIALENPAHYEHILLQTK